MSIFKYVIRNLLTGKAIVQAGTGNHFLNKKGWDF